MSNIEFYAQIYMIDNVIKNNYFLEKHLIYAEITTIFQGLTIYTYILITLYMTNVFHA